MIELIFSIAVIGIVLLSAPMLISMATKSAAVALQQESINEAAAHINILFSYPWDENNINAPCPHSPSILHTDSSTSQLSKVSGTYRRIGVPPNSSSHSFSCLGSEYNATAIGLEGAEKDDLDDFDGTAYLQRIFDDPSPENSKGIDYIENPENTNHPKTVDIATEIRYINDVANYNNSFNYNFDFNQQPTHSSNIKGIKVTLTSSSGIDELQKTIVMYGFSCNTGSYNYAQRKVK